MTHCIDIGEHCDRHQGDSVDYKDETESYPSGYGVGDAGLFVVAQVVPDLGLA